MTSSETARRCFLLTGLGGSGVNKFADKWVYTAVEVVAVAVCASRAVLRRQDRLA